MIKITSLFAILFLIVVVVSLTTTSLFVSAQVPSRVPCQCVRGVTRDTSADHCKCSGSCSVADYVLPFCTFKNADRVNMAIRYKNVTGFALDTAEAQIQGHLGVDGDDVKWIRRLAKFEKGDGSDVVVQYLITGSYVDGIYTDVYATVQPAYIASPQALDMWQMGTIVAEPGVFSKYYSSGNVLSELSFTYSGEKITVRLVDTQLAFLIGAFSVVLFCAIIEGVINLIAKPKETPEQVAEREALMNSMQPQSPQDPNQQPSQVYPSPQGYPEAQPHYGHQPTQGQEMQKMNSPPPSGYDAGVGASSTAVVGAAAYDNSTNNPLSYDHQDPIPLGKQQPQEIAQQEQGGGADEHPNYVNDSSPAHDHHHQHDEHHTDAYASPPPPPPVAEGGYQYDAPQE